MSLLDIKALMHLQQEKYPRVEYLLHTLTVIVGGTTHIRWEKNPLLLNVIAYVGL
jgi:hypothetical protein